jgi:tripartite-type tricarboxylate transporter receptor subunit TctC
MHIFCVESFVFRRMCVGVVAAAMACLGLSFAVLAQGAYPEKPITLIVPFAAGGTSDVIARIVSDQMSQNLGQRIIFENIGGAGGTSALSRAARAAPDGYTLVIGNTGTNAASYSIYAEITYKPEDFAPIGLAAKTSPMIAVKKDLVAKTLLELVAEMKANPGKITLGHAGTGSSNHLICLTFLRAAGADATLIGYRGAAPALNDLMGGQIDGVCDAATSLQSAVGAGQVRALAVATPTRMPGMPDIPTSAEAGLPAFAAQGWNAYFAPKGTPEPIIRRLNEALNAALKSELLLKRFTELQTFPASAEEATPAFVADLVPREIARYRQLLGK